MAEKKHSYGPLSYSEMGEMVRTLRKRNKLTQFELGEKAKCNYCTISNFERGRERSSFLILEDIFGVLGYDVKFIITPREEK